MFESFDKKEWMRPFIKDGIHDPWEGTRFEGYVASSAKRKGIFGEQFADEVFKSSGYSVKPAHSSTAGHDRVINGYKVEIKFGLSTKKKKSKKRKGYTEYVNKQLKKLCSLRDLSNKGKKACLVKRLKEWDLENLPDKQPLSYEDVRRVMEEMDPPEIDYGVIKDSFVINHVSKAKDWDYLMAIYINPVEADIRLFWFNNEDFVKHIDGCGGDLSGSAFNYQQGGKKIKNDDYMLSGVTSLHKLMKYDWVHTTTISPESCHFEGPDTPPLN
tara:strand:+ start:4945 stop:5757 length:813 start_codon:yes stop_codon:yes gene_type:complete